MDSWAQQHTLVLVECLTHDVGLLRHVVHALDHAEADDGVAFLRCLVIVDPDSEVLAVGDAVEEDVGVVLVR